MSVKSVDTINRNILFVTPFMETGGTEKVIFDLAKGLIPKGWDVYIASSGGRFVAQIEALGATHFQVDSLSRKTPGALIGSMRAIKDIVARCDIGIVNSHSYVAAVAAAMTSFCSKYKFHHTFTLHIPERETYFRIMGLTLNWMVDEVYTVCEWNRRKLVNLGVRGERITVVYNGVDTEYFNSPEKRLQSGNWFNIGMVARLVERKGHIILLRAVRKYLDNNPAKKIKLHFYGNGPIRSTLYELSKEIGLDGSVLFHGDVSDVRGAYYSMDLFVLPSYSEGLPLTILEAMSAGVPVVATAVNGVPEIVNNGHTGITFSPGDEEALCHIIGDMIDNPELRKKLSYNSGIQVREAFDTNVMVLNYDKLFLSAAMRDLSDSKLR